MYNAGCVLQECSSSAIAKDYTVNINTSSGKASVLKTCPADNVNHEYSFKDISGFTLGVTGSLEGDKNRSISTYPDPFNQL